jgi:hypothetical protein
VEKETQPEQLQTERHPHQASVLEGRENVIAFLALDPPRRHNTTTNSVAYADYCRAMSLGCTISQTWTPYCQDNLSVARATMSSSAARTEEGQEQDRCHTRFWGQNQMHSICVSRSIFHTYVDVTSVIYQKTMQ